MADHSLGLRRGKGGTIVVVLRMGEDARGVALTPQQAREMGEEMIAMADKIVREPHEKRTPEVPPS